MSNSAIVPYVRKSWWDFSVIEIFGNYSWFLLIFTFVVIYVFRRAKRAIGQFSKDLADGDYVAKYHKTTQQAAMQRLQEKYNKNAMEYQRKMEEKEERRRQEILSRPCNNEYKSGSASTSYKQQSLKPEYNPLMGHNSRSYKPQRKSPCSGGGCGKK